MAWAKFDFQGVCMGIDVSRGVERQKTCGSLRQNLQMPTIKQQAKDVFNLTVYIKYYLAFLFYL